jgi:hypothetical protein
MKQSSPARQRLTSLALLGLPLLTYPILSLPVGMWAGMPADYIYLFGVWAGLIVLAARVAEKKA